MMLVIWQGLRTMFMHKGAGNHTVTTREPAAPLLKLSCSGTPSLGNSDFKVKYSMKLKNGLYSQNVES